MLKKRFNFKDLTNEDEIINNIQTSMFNPWKNYILETLKNNDDEHHLKKFGNSNSTIEDIWYYKINPANNLLIKAIEHKNHYSSKIQKPIILAIVHPFYRNLFEKTTYEDEKLKKINEYLDDLEYVCNNIKPDTDILLIDTLHSYAAASHKLLEKRIVKNVLFTAHKRGYTLDEKELNEYKKNQIIIAGGSIEVCGLDFSIDLINQKISKKNMTFVKDLLYTKSDKLDEMNGIKKMKDPYNSIKFMPKKHLIDSQELCN